MDQEIGYSTIVKRNIENTVKEGSFNSIKVGIGESYINAFAIKVLNASALQIGFLSSVPLLLGYLSNILTVKAVNVFKSRKKLIMFFSLINALCFVLILLSFFIKGYEFLFLFLSVTIYFVSDLFIVPAWVSLIGDIIPDKIKSIYFGERNKINNLLAFVSLLIGGGYFTILFWFEYNLFF